MARWLSRRPAELAGLGERKGRLLAGHDADLVVWDPEGTFEVRPERLHHRHSLTPYAGRRLEGVVLATFLRGHVIWEKETFSSLPGGRPLSRPRAA